MPNLILQPLVENAIKHGVARKSGPGHIQITRASRRRQALDGSPGRRRRAVAGRVAHAPQGDRRVDDARAAAAALRRRLPLRVPPPQSGSRGHRRIAVARRVVSGRPADSIAPTAPIRSAAAGTLSSIAATVRHSPYASPTTGRDTNHEENQDAHRGRRTAGARAAGRRSWRSNRTSRSWRSAATAKRR